MRHPTVSVQLTRSADRGRLRRAGDKYEYDVFHARSTAYRVDQYRGTLAELLEDDGYAQMPAWLSP